MPEGEYNDGCYTCPAGGRAPLRKGCTASLLPPAVLRCLPASHAHCRYAATSRALHAGLITRIYGDSWVCEYPWRGGCTGWERTASHWRGCFKPAWAAPQHCASTLTPCPSLGPAYPECRLRPCCLPLRRAETLWRILLVRAPAALVPACHRCPCRRCSFAAVATPANLAGSPRHRRVRSRCRSRPAHVQAPIAASPNLRALGRVQLHSVLCAFRVVCAKVSPTSRRPTLPASLPTRLRPLACQRVCSCGCCLKHPMRRCYPDGYQVAAAVKAAGGTAAVASAASTGTVASAAAATASAGKARSIRPAGHP